MVWWLEGATSRHFGWVRNPLEAIFSYFWSQGINQKFFFQENRFFPKNRRFFSDFFTSDFSFSKSFPTQPKTDFSSKNRPKKNDFFVLDAYTSNISYHLNMLIHISYLLIIPCFISYHFTLCFMFLSQYTCHHIAVLYFSYHIISFHMSYSSHLFYVSCLHKP